MLQTFSLHDAASFPETIQFMQITLPRGLGRIQDGGPQVHCGMCTLAVSSAEQVRRAGCFDSGTSNFAALKVLITFFTTICVPYPLLFNGLCSWTSIAILSAHEGPGYFAFTQRVSIIFGPKLGVRTRRTHK